MATTSLNDNAKEFREATRKLKDALDKKEQTRLDILKENIPKLIDASSKEAVINMLGSLAGGTLSGMAFVMHCMDAGIDPMGNWGGIQLLLSVFGGIMLPKINIPLGICLITYYGVKFYRG